MAQISSIIVRVDAAKAERRIAWLARLPLSLRRVFPIGIALWWVMRGVKVEV